MGIIKKQALQSTVVNFVGIGFGAVSRFMMPFFMSRSEIGILQMIDSVSGMFIVVFNFGYNLILKKVFPSYRDDENGHAGFLMFGILLSLAGIICGVGTYYLLEGLIVSNNSGNQELLKPFLFLIPLLIISKILFVNIDGYVRMLYKTVVGTFFDGFLAKILTCTLVFIAFYALIDFKYFVYLYCFILALPGLLILIFAIYRTEKITWPSRQIFQPSNKIGTYVLFGILSGSSGSIIQYVDTIMIYKMIPDEATTYLGVYAIMMFASVLIGVPARNVNKISSVVLAESWKKDDLNNIQDVYEKSAINLLLVGSFLFLLGWALMDPVLDLLPEYHIGKYVFFFLGLAKLVELGTGVNAEIIETSEKYKYTTYFNLILAVFVILFNFVFIYFFGIVGAAFASFLAILIVNIFRAILLHKIYNLWPFTLAFYRVILILVVFVTAISFVQYDANPILKIALNGVVVTTIFWIVIIKLKLSKDINDAVFRMKKRIFKK